MSVLFSGPAPTTASPTRASRLGTHRGRQRLVTAGLGAVVAAALRALDDLHDLSPDVTSGDLVHTLHAALERHEQRVAVAAGADPLARSAIALRIASAHLGAGDLVEACIALRGAHEALPRGGRATVGVDT